VSPTKTAEQIEVPFGDVDLGGPRNRVLGAGRLSPGVGATWGYYLGMPRVAVVDSLNIIRKGSTAMRPLTTSVVATCCVLAHCGTCVCVLTTQVDILNFIR